MQGRLHVDSLKSAGNGPIHSPVSGPIKIKHKQTKGKQTNKTDKTTTKPKPNKTREVGSLPALRKEMHDDILCVIMSMATENEAKRRQHGTTRRGHESG